MTFRFGCGEGFVSVNLDGYSHASGLRRAYAKCPNHTKRFKYSSLARWEKPWMAVAFVLIYMRRDIDAADKLAHLQVPEPTKEELNDGVGEMPIILYDMPVSLS